MEVLEAINRTGTTIVMATHNEEIVNSMRKRVVELHTGKIVRDEARGSYDSAKFFPDAEVEAKAQHAIQGGAIETHAEIAEEIAPTPEVAGAPAELDNDTESGTDVRKAVDGSEQGDEGIARLANSVHSGRKGRYGEAFAPVETTLTWGKGIRLDTPSADAVEESTEEKASTSGSASDQGSKQQQTPVESKGADSGSDDASAKNATVDGEEESHAKAVPAPPIPPSSPKGEVRGVQAEPSENTEGSQSHGEDQGDK
jgi:cell division transport system ATP-binding protein